MDKRSFLFVIALSATLFLVNMYFENQHQEKLRVWNAQQKAKNVEKVASLEEAITQHTAQLSDLPIASVYLDNEGKQWVTEGVISGDNLLVLSWNKTMPDTIYVGEDHKTYHLAAQPNDIEAPVLYQSDKKSPLNIVQLPEFGTFDLQLVVPFANPQDKAEVVLGEYVDGHFTIPKDRILQLKGEKDKAKTVRLSAIALMKSGNGYLPVAVFNPKTQTLSSLDNFANLSLNKPDKVVTSQTKTEQKYYVIENDYQQLVFTNVGGALAEINLPFQSEKNQKSTVKEIEIDRDMKSNHPYNDYFPAHAFYKPGNSPKNFTAVDKGQIGGYYPLLRRDLIQNNNRQSVKMKPGDYALNIISEYPEIAELVYEVTHFDNNKIVFEVQQPHRRIKKTYTTEPEGKDAPYVINLTIEVEGDSRGLWLTSGVPEVEIVSGSPAPSLKYRVTRNDKSQVENIDLPKDSITFSTVKPDWGSNSNGFLGMILDPLTPIDTGIRAQLIPGTVAPSRLIEVEEEYQKYKAQDMPGYELLLPLNSSGGTMKFRYFAGPFSTDILKAIDKVYADPTTGYNPDYIASQSFHGWFSFISEPFAKFLFILMNFFHSITHSWGISIILLTVALRIMMYPLNAWSTRSMLRMQEIAPEVTAIQEKYKKDPKKAQVEIMNLYRERGVNPVSGCFPLLIQMPFLIGMFDLLKSTVELRGASFIPGWIDDLTAPDVLFRWKTPIWFFGNEFHLLPILLGVVMFLQQRMMSNAPKDVNLMTEQQRQQRMMGNMMTIVFAVMFYNFPSGLNIYWLSSMLLGMLQQWWMQKRMAAAAANAGTNAVKKK